MALTTRGECHGMTLNLDAVCGPSSAVICRDGHRLQKEWLRPHLVTSNRMAALLVVAMHAAREDLRERRSVGFSCLLQREDGGGLRVDFDSDRLHAQEGREAAAQVLSRCIREDEIIRGAFITDAHTQALAAPAGEVAITAVDQHAAVMIVYDRAELSNVSLPREKGAYPCAGFWVRLFQEELAGAGALRSGTVGAAPDCTRVSART